MYTYAQNFEDVMLRRLFREQESGFYVDVGAWDPTSHSVTKYFYLNGWHGVNVEPIRSKFELLQRDRPHDVNLNVAVGEQSHELPFFECVEESYLSTADPAIAARIRATGRTVREYSVPVVTLNEIFETHCPNTVDFLKIDVEGWEAHVVKGCDWGRFRPRVLVIEATRPNTRLENWDHPESIAAWHDWEPILLSNGYVFAYFDGLSRFYLHDEEAALAKRLQLPPGIFDDIRYEEFDAVRRDQQAKQAAIEALDRDVKKQQKVIEFLHRDQIALHKDQQAKQALIDRLVDKSENLSRRIEDLSGRITGKNEVLKMLGNEAVGFRSCLKGGLDLAYRWRRRTGFADNGGGRLISSPAYEQASLRRVAIDAMSIQFGISGGVETCMRVLVLALLRNAGIGVAMLCLEGQLPKLQGMFGDRVAYLVFGRRPPLRMAHTIRAKLRSGRDVETAEQVVASFARLRDDLRAEILHSPVQVFSRWDFSVPSVFHLHDLQHLHLPENFSQGDLESRNYFYRLAADLSNAIIAISDFVRDDIISKMNVRPSKVFKLPSTWDPLVEQGLETFSPQMARATYKLPEVFGLYPAQFWLHKNHARLVEALAITRERIPEIDFKLVFTGYRGHSGWPKAQEAIERWKMQDHVLCLDFVPIDHLAALYKCATFCVVPSLFEGQGLPVLEAQLLSCPVMGANATALPELMVGGVGLLFDPLSPDDIADKMVRWLRDPGDRRAHAERAFQWVRREYGPEAYLEGVMRIYDAIDPR